MYLVEGTNINDIQITLFSLLKNKGEKVLVRNFNTLEIYPVSIHLTNIRNRCTTILERKWNIIFALGEFCWHLSGSNKLNNIHYYSKNWELISDDREHITESCYGSKIFKESDDWQNLILELRKDIYSRRAVINLYSSEHSLGKNMSDVSCTLSLQFLYRNDKLDLIVTMRSNDIVWGLPNDIFFFTLLQEYLAKLLNVVPGDYYHQVASLHIYDRHYDILNRINQNPEYFDFNMPAMNNIEIIDDFLEQENELRIAGNHTKKLESPYWQELLEILKLRSSYIEPTTKNKIIKNSRYNRVIELCPTRYIKHLTESANF